MTMSRSVTMGVVAVVFVVFVNAVTLCAQEGSLHPALPWASPLRAVRTTSVLAPWDRLPLPSLALPAWGMRAHVPTHTNTHTHILPLMRVLLFDVQSGSLAGSLYLGEMGRLVPWGAKEGQGIPGRELGVTITLALSRNSFFFPHPRVPPPCPKEVALVYSEDLVTVSLFPKI